MAADPATPATSTPADAPQVPEVTPALRRRLKACFDHAVKLMSQDKYDHEYAHTLLADCVVNDPANLEYIEALFSNLQKKFAGKKAGVLGGMGGRGGNIKRLVANKEWQEAFRDGLEGLRGNPWDVGALRGLAQACEALRLNEVELRYLKGALDASPKDIEVNKHCALSLARMGQFDQAIACWHRIEELQPRNAEAPRMISDLTIEKARVLSGLGDEDEEATDRPMTVRNAPGKGGGATMPGAPRPQAAKEQEPAPANVETETRRREIPLMPRQKLERAIADDPAEIGNYLALADLMREEGRFAEAEQVLHRALQASGGDIRVRERLEDAQIGRAQSQAEIAEKRAAVDGTEEARQAADRERENALRLELDVYQRRCDRYPNDMLLRYELGKRLKRSGNFAEAARYFDEARRDETKKGAALLQMGECLQQIKQFKRALACYEAAARALADGDRTRRLLAMYRAGILAAGLKQWDTADKYLVEVVAVDPSFRDAAERLDKVRSIRDKE